MYAAWIVLLMLKWCFKKKKAAPHGWLQTA